MNADIVEIDPRQPFVFSCGPSVSCFNRCCRDLNQFLTPYDILRLKTGLKMSSGAFLSHYAAMHDGPETGLPVVSFRTRASDGHRCPLVSETGCRAYPDRPSSCRSYPLVRMASRCRRTGRITARYFLLREAHCRGLESGGTQTAARWIEDQELSLYNEMNDRMLDLISLKNRRRPGPLEPASRHLFATALYDLDRFRRQTHERQLLEDDRFDPKLREAAGTDEVALLQLAMDWVGRELFSPGTAAE